MDRNKKEVLKHLSNTHGRLANRITSLEKKTKDQISYLSNSMKETIAQVSEIEMSRIFCVYKLGGITRTVNNMILLIIIGKGRMPRSHGATSDTRSSCIRQASGNAKFSTQRRPVGMARAPN